MSVDLEALACGVAFDLNCTIRKNISNNKRTNPLRPQLTTHESKSRIIQLHFLPNHEVLLNYHAIMELLSLFFVELGILVGF